MKDFPFLKLYLFYINNYVYNEVNRTEFIIVCFGAVFKFIKENADKNVSQNLTSKRYCIRSCSRKSYVYMYNK